MTKSKMKMKSMVEVLHFEAECTNDVYIQFKLQQRIQKRLDEGWTYRSSVTLAGKVYLSYVGKFREDLEIEVCPRGVVDDSKDCTRKKRQWMKRS